MEPKTSKDFEKQAQEFLKRLNEYNTSASYALLKPLAYELYVTYQQGMYEQIIWKTLNA